MTRLADDECGGRNVSAFLDMIACSEIGEEVLRLSDDGYNVCVGSTPTHLVLMRDYTTHPRLYCEPLNSDAAGRYQLLGRYWGPYQRMLKLRDFGPENQDRIALQLLRECHAIALLDQGKFQDAVIACVSRWASLPGSPYGQHENQMTALQAVYLNVGGAIA